ncbi:putative cell division cycle 45 (CDC45) [Leishmania major strain Friedlin]|uniref:Putative cell division cycle 45 (CDC45) n=1 Tax=Leishmania major TaxID=5664 RepID=Q4Q3V5_LEIMA|nr:putative cell division cycle 45 (CDC45) [Leishmania major strain Friedlin]CAG9580848.1 cell_division_cycle_45_(CDC45)_-_putative [Leishmania major strain Friedlin]CAJ06627.1 putative cell division cycle 45 (CDC45) [Leishmania major strain Friedlin]|eukprot:XP_001685993.1 putative cell division cycle 45 (CDC45) [Leishmania major strain Friedlin]
MATASGALEPWERISTYYASTRKSINVLVAPTADAAAASLSLTYLMKVFLFPFQLHPTSSYDELKWFIEQANFAQDSEREDDISLRIDDLFILVGLGAPVLLEDYFDFTRHIVIVLDAYRPFHLGNLCREDGDRCIIWGSDRIQVEVDDFFRKQRAEEAQRRRRHRRRLDMKRHEGHARRQRTEGGGAQDDDVYSDESSISTSSEEEESADSDGDEAADLFDGEDDDATPSQSQDRVDWRSAPGEVPAYLEALYYACSCAGRSSAVEVYDLSVILHRFNDTILWHAAVGVCDLYLRRLVDYATYLVEMGPLEEAVSLQQSVRRGILRDRTDEAVNSYHRASTNSMQLSNREEEQLYLLRHSTLWDAIWYDSQVASALDLHHVEDGRPRLSQLLASRCGVSIAMAQRPWCEVPTDVGSEALRRVQVELQNWVNAQGNFIAYRNRIRCISRKVGYSTEVSTFDVCKLFTAEMAAVPPASVYVIERSPANASLSPEEVAALAQRKLVEFQRGQFWRASAVLDIDPNEKLFHEALAGALSLQQAVADATGSMMQPGNVQSSTGIHYALPSDPSKTSPTLESFCTMRRLSVLAERLFFTLSMSRRRDRRALTALRPLILSCVLPQARLAAPPTASSGSGSGLPCGPGTDALVPAVHWSRASGGVPSASAATAAGGVFMGGGAQVEDTAEYVVVLTHAGNTGAGMMPLLPVYRFAQCMQDEHFHTPPRRLFVERNAVQVRGRENTTYLAERMLLLSVKTTVPRHEFRKRRAPAVDEYDDDDGGTEVVEVVD